LLRKPNDFYVDREFLLEANEEDVLTYYATATQVAIAVYRTEFQAKRVAMYYPMNWDLDLRKLQELPIVSILLHDGHALAITHLREFIHGKTSANRTHMNSFCHVCQRIRTANHATKDDCAAHFVQCLEKHEGMLENVDRIHARHYNVDSYTPPMCRYNKKVRGSAPYNPYVCYANPNGFYIESVLCMFCMSSRYYWGFF
jgi:hypothetical protein